MSQGEQKKNILPLIITVVLCAVFIFFINRWARRQIEVREKVTAADVLLREEPEKETISPAEQATRKEPARPTETKIEKIDQLLDAQYEVYSKESEKEKTTTTSKYNIYPSEEELKEMKRKKLLMY